MLQMYKCRVLATSPPQLRLWYGNGDAIIRRYCSHKSK